MLKDVLREIKNSDYISKNNIAIKLNKSESLIEEAFFQLDRMGYINEDEGMSTCDLPCGNCPYSGPCSTVPVKSFKITEKGEKLLKK